MLKLDRGRKIRKDSILNGWLPTLDRFRGVDWVISETIETCLGTPHGDDDVIHTVFCDAL